MKKRAIAMLLCLSVLFALVPASGETNDVSATVNAGEGSGLLLTRGSRGEEVKKVQQKLIELGFMTGSADGVFGAATEKGVKAFETYVNTIRRNERKAQREQLIARAEAEQKLRAEAYRLLAPETAVAGASLAKNETTAKKQTNAFLKLVIAGGAETMNIPAANEDATGQVTEELYAYLTGNRFTICRETLARGSRGAEVTRLQTRLNALRYLTGGIDGQYGAGTQAALMYFQKRNSLAQTGEADEATQCALFSEAAVKSDRPTHEYLVKISVGKQKVYVYKWHYGEYSTLVKSMSCSTGTKENPTPYGSFSMGGPCGRWYYFQKFDCWAQYAYRITGGILFHSVLYSEKDTSTLRQGSVSALGSRASHGCVRLAVSDAKWLYNNVSAGSTCVIGA